MTAGCSVTLEFKQINKEKKRQWSQALSKQPGCSPCLVNNLVTSYVVLLAFPLNLYSGSKLCSRLLDSL